MGTSAVSIWSLKFHARDYDDDYFVIAVASIPRLDFIVLKLSNLCKYNNSFNKE